MVLIGIPAAVPAALQRHQALNLALAFQGIRGCLTPQGHEGCHGLLVALDHKLLSARRPFQ